MILHTDIQVLPFIVFERCVVDSNLQGLIIEGEPEQADLLEAWSNLYAQCLDLTGDAETRYNLLLQRDITLLAAKIGAVEAAVAILEIRHEDLVVIALKEMGIDTSKLNPDSHRYPKELKKLKVQLARFKLELKEKQNELLQRGGDDHEAVTREYFTSILSRLSRFQHYRLNKQELTVGEFYAHLKEYNIANTKKVNTWPAAEGEE